MTVAPPLRVTRSYTQHLHAPVARVFPLLCPVREAEWIEGWAPSLVLTNSGAAEPDCVFVTSDGDHEATWYVTHHSPADGVLEMLKVIPGIVVTRIGIRVEPMGGDACTADIRYQQTALSGAGAARVKAFDEAHFRDFMMRWERRLNHYLATGTMLHDSAAAPPSATAG